MILRGRVAWAKVLGKASKGYDENEREWSIDFEPTAEGIQKYLNEGGSDFYLKQKENHPLETFIAFKRKEIKRDGTPAQPIKVLDSKGQPWDPDVKIGNLSVVEAKFALNGVTVGRAKRLKPSLIALRVVEHVPYEGKGNDSDFEDFVFDDENWDS